MASPKLMRCLSKYFKWNVNAERYLKLWAVEYFRWDFFVDKDAIYWIF